VLIPIHVISMTTKEKEQAMESVIFLLTKDATY
jgi:hypothetical protein